MENISFCFDREHKVGSFQNFPVYTGITTVRMGSFKSPNGCNHLYEHNERLSRLTGVDHFVSMVPEHGKKVITLPLDRSKIQPSYNCDSITYFNLENPDMRIGMYNRAADCPGVAITDGKIRFINLTHSGLVSTRMNILGYAIEKIVNDANRFKLYDVHPKKFFLAIHPCGGPCCYEVGINERKNFSSEHFNKRNLDLVGILIKQAMDCGVLRENIFTSDVCTYHQKNGLGRYIFFSHRRSTYNKNFPNGRNAIFVTT